VIVEIYQANGDLEYKKNFNLGLTVLIQFWRETKKKNEHPNIKSL